MALVNPLEKAMAPHSSTLAWKIPGTGEPGGLQAMGSHRVGHDRSAAAAAAANPYISMTVLIVNTVNSPIKRYYISMIVLIVNILNSSMKRHRTTRLKLFLSLLTKFYSLRNTFCRAIDATDSDSSDGSGQNQPKTF